jgi:hypothetical protein
MAITDYYCDLNDVTIGNAGTPADPFSWVDVVTRMNGGAAAPGDRYNIRGSITRTVTDTFINDGLATSPIIFRGCYGSGETWNVITPTRSAYNGALVTTNYPYINYNGNFGIAASNSNNMILSALRISSGYTGASAVRVGTLVVAYGLSVSNSASNASSYAFFSGGSGACILSDFSCSGTTAGQYAVYMSNGEVIGCRVSDSAGYGIWFNASGTCISNAFYGCDSYAIGVSAGLASNRVIALYNTFHGGSGGITMGDVAHTGLSIILGNHSTDGSGYAFYSPNATGGPVALAYNRTRDNVSGPVYWNGDWATASTWSHVTSGEGLGPTVDYVNAPTDLNLVPTAAGVDQGIMSSDIGALQRAEKILPNVDDVWHTSTNWGERGAQSGIKTASTIDNCVPSNIKTGVVIDDVTGTQGFYLALVKNS